MFLSIQFTSFFQGASPGNGCTPTASTEKYVRSLQQALSYKEIVLLKITDVLPKPRPNAWFARSAQRLVYTFSSGLSAAPPRATCCYLVGSDTASPGDPPPSLFHTVPAAAFSPPRPQSGCSPDSEILHSTVAALTPAPRSCTHSPRTGDPPLPRVSPSLSRFAGCICSSAALQNPQSERAVPPTPLALQFMTQN